MPPTFYFAIGGRAAPADLRIALAVDQRDFLIPAGATLTTTLRDLAGVRIVLDSGAWPLDNPDRLSLEAYAAEILRWRRPDGTWGNLAWAAAYDHLDDPGRSQRDTQRLLGLLAEAGAADCPIVPVTHYPGPAVTQILLDLQLGTAGTRADVVDLGGAAQMRPGYAIGGLVPALSPICPRDTFATADAWYTRLLQELEQATHGAEDGVAEPIDPNLLALHLFGIGRPAFVLRSPLVASFDSSGPAKQASIGWQKIAPSYNPSYGFSAEKLQTSRLARMAYWLIRYRDLVGLPWTAIDETAVADDATPPPAVQTMLRFDRAA